MPNATEPTSPTPAWTRDDLARNPHSAPDKAARVQRMFASIAPRYDLNNRLHSFSLDKKWRRRAVELARVTPNDHVLDAACGTGDLTFLFSQAGARRTIGVDFSQPMLDIALRKERAAIEAGTIRQGSIEFVQADMTRLPYDEGTFDIVASAFGLRNVDRPEVALRELRRVLRTGGRLVILDFSRPSNPFVRAVNHVYMRFVVPFTASLIARDRSGAYHYLPRSVETFPEGNELEQVILAAGFARTERHPLTFGVCTITIGWV